MIDTNYLLELRKPSVENPLRIMMSACLSGISCGFDGTTYGDYPSALQLLKYPNVKITAFCPEDFSFGTPREMCDIHGGTGEDVLDGKAKLVSESGVDWSEGIIKASEKMLEIAIENKIELAVMMDISAACGSQVIYSGSRYSETKQYQIGAGVAAAQLLRHGFKVISQRDFAALEIVFSKIDPDHSIDKSKLNHDQTEWYASYFGQKE